DVIAKLDEEGLLPAITFIFSRAGCDAAVKQCLGSRLRVNPETAADRIDEIINKHTGELPRADLEVLGFWDWREALHRGFAAHHAGMLPAFRHTVEELFVNGLVRAVFATETLALGINMPARTVVLEKLIKYNGEAHVELTPGEYTQLTGRAGRRGIDVEGHAVVLWYPELNASGVAGLASTRTYPLKSSFTPGYNMSINLIGHLGAEMSRKLLERSFAQFQADRSVVGLVRGIEKNDFQLAKLRSQLERADGNFLEYVQLRERIKNRERELNRQKRETSRDTAERDLFGLRRGDVISIPRGRREGIAVVIEPARDERDPRPVVVTEGAWSGRITIGDVPNGAPVLGTMRLPRHLERNTGPARRDIASGLRSTGIRPPKGKQKRAPEDDDRELNLLRRALRSHPSHRAPDVEAMCRIGEQYHRILRETDAMRMKVASTTNSLVRTFDRIVGLLSDRGYLVDGEATEAGHRLARLYSESDLLVAECLRHGTWTGLSPVELAAVVSTMVYESRGDKAYDNAAGLNSRVRNALTETMNIWAGLRDDEARHKLSGTREPDMGFAHAAFTWASGGSLADSLAAGGDRGVPLAAGDFVRWCRQVIDLLDQLKAGADDPQISTTAARAIKAIRRGVVAVDAA
ncbi:MAG: DEAD/DEAH box helicase, partial [Nocardiaceae bacterium]|nr:DEAD/DEAH box helicase [Nocardiaceae bacterium]